MRGHDRPRRGNVSDRKDDPAFIYFPTNYRWSMGLLLCLSAAPWGGAEIDEVNRVGRALARQDRRRQRLVRGMGADGRHRRGARPRRREEGPHTDRRRLPDAGGALLPDRRALPAARAALARHLQEGGEVVCRRRGDAEAAAHRVGGDSVRRQDHAGAVRASRAGGGRRQARAGAWCSSTASTSPRRFNISRAFPISWRAASPA